MLSYCVQLLSGANLPDGISFIMLHFGISDHGGRFFCLGIVHPFVMPPVLSERAQ